MIVDSSALIAILREEPEMERFSQLIADSSIVRISAANYFESAAVMDGHRDPIISRRFDEFVREARFVIEPVGEEQARVAREAYRDFGRGSGHPAKLNFGDCFAYALAKVKGEPLLFKGNDFRKTDITPALP